MHSDSLATVFAYLDPGSGSMILQVLLGGVAAVGVAAKMYWKKFTGIFRRGSKDDATPTATAATDNGAGPAGPGTTGADASGRESTELV